MFQPGERIAVGTKGPDLSKKSRSRRTTTGADRVISITLFALALLCPLVGSGVGIAVRRRLPEHHLSSGSIDVIKLAMGLMATLVALTLGLLIQSANRYRSEIETEYRRILASIVHLDEYLQAYGPETRNTREHVRQVALLSFHERWPNEDFGPIAAMPDPGPGRYTEIQRQIVALQPSDAAQRWFQSQALQITNRISDLRWLVMSQQSAHAPLIPVFALIFLASMAIFGSFSLYARPNATVTTVISLAALAIAGSTFLIVELNNPFQGLLHISSDAAHGVAQSLGH